MQEPSVKEDCFIKYFHRSNELYKKCQYNQCYEMITKCIEIDRTNSCAYSNQAVLAFQLQKPNHYIIQNLIQSIAINHLNYIAYFNLFSIQFRIHEKKSAYQNLCFGLSSAYTITAKLLKSLDFIEKALFYSYNNQQAKFLKAMIQIQNKRYFQALVLLKQLSEVNHDNNFNKILMKIIQEVEVKIGIKRIPGKFFEKNSTFQTKGFELMTNLQMVDDQLYIQTITKMVEQFNVLYQILNNKHTFHRLSKAPESQISASESLVSALQRQQYQKESAEINETNIENSSDRENDVSTYEKEHSQKSQLFENKLLHLNSYLKTKSGKEQKFFLQCEKEQKFILQGSATMESSQIYPLKKNGQKIQFYIEKVHFLARSNEEVNSMKAIYAILSFNEKNNKRKIRTAISKCEDRFCFWRESDELLLSQEPSDMKLKVYNKSYLSFRDDFLGEVEMAIISTGKLCVPIFDKKEVKTGEVYLNLSVVGSEKANGSDLNNE